MFVHAGGRPASLASRRKWQWRDSVESLDCDLLAPINNPLTVITPAGEPLEKHDPSAFDYFVTPWC